jgi:hypothetical protein
MPTCTLLLFLLQPMPPVDADWPANAELQPAKSYSLAGLGAIQGVSRRGDRLYIYGDVYDANPRVGKIREFDMDMKPTGKEITLARNGKPLLVHPTGLTWDDKLGCFLGDTVNRRAVIYKLDWDRALADGHLDNAVLAILDDDAAVNGCRPEFVTVGGKVLLATADYGDARPEVRLYDIEKMLAAKRSSAPGVVVHRILVGPFNQNLAWDPKTKQLTCIQNVVAGLGWRLDVLDLEKAVADGRANGPGVRVRMQTLPPHTELEGYLSLGEGRGVFVTSHRSDNVWIGTAASTPERNSPKGTTSVRIKE